MRTPDWDQIDTVLLDMDGTVLDLAYDNHFWRHAVPAAFAAANNLTVEETRDKIQPWFDRVHGTLDWYCIDYWSQQLGLDIAAMKSADRTRIGYLDGALASIQAMRAAGYAVWITTNAHAQVYAIKSDHTGLGAQVDAAHSAHSFGASKESQVFWQNFARETDISPARCLFVDDSAPVRAAAREFGIGQVWGITRPDTSGGEIAVTDGPAVPGISALIPPGGLPAAATA